MRPIHLVVTALLLAGCGSEPGTGPDVRPSAPRPELAEPLRDAIARIVPGLEGAGDSGAIGPALEWLALALESGEAEETEAASAKARSAIERYAAAANAEAAEVEALRLAVEQVER